MNKRHHPKPRDQAGALTWAQLTDRQRDVLRLIARGRTNDEIADAIGYALSTTKTLILQTRYSLGCRNRTQLATIAALECNGLWGLGWLGEDAYV